MTLKQICLGDIIRIKHGFAFKSQFFRDAGKYVVLTPGHFFETGGFRDRPEKDRFYDGEFSDEFILPQRALIIAMTQQGPGLLGSSALVPEGDRYLHNQRIGLVTITNPAELDKEFLYRLFNTRSVRSQVEASASGTKVRHTAPERVYRVAVSIPNLDCQQRIAAILRSYDDLIETNRRRIRLLKDAERLLYQEWFVRFRFPGHEHVKIIKGAPEGWTHPTLGEYAPLQYGKALREDQRRDGPVPVFGSSGIVGNHNLALVSESGIIVGRKGNVGSVYFSDEPFWPIDTTYYIAGAKATRFLYYSLLATPFLNTDVAVPGLNRDLAHSRHIVIPPDPLLKMFEDSVAAIFRMATVLEREITALSKARDLLLPRLMSGEVEI